MTCLIDESFFYFVTLYTFQFHTDVTLSLPWVDDPRSILEGGLMSNMLAMRAG